jgi:hypothetical protein
MANGMPVLADQQHPFVCVERDDPDGSGMRHHVAVKCRPVL